MAARPRALVVRAAGTNCDMETAHAFQLAGAESHTAHIHAWIRRPPLIHDYQILAIPGGFSYGDDVSAGRIFANQLRDVLGDMIRAFIANGGLVLGICNGFQVLVKLGLLPGFRDHQAGSGQTVSLIDNDSGRYEDRWVHLRVQTTRSVFLKNMDALYLPVAHAEGKLVVQSEEVLKQLQTHEQIALRYVTSQGAIGGYPDNPNGSIAAIAGLCDTTGRVLGMMPHPERFLIREHHPHWTRLQCPDKGQGLALFENAVQYCR